MMILKQMQKLTLLFDNKASKSTQLNTQTTICERKQCFPGKW